MVDDLRRLVEIESPSADAEACARAGDALVDIVETRLGVRPEAHDRGERRHLLWRFGPTIDVLLIGHIDTVFPTGTLAERPFAVDDEGIATGPGVYDMKSGLVQAIHAVAMLADRRGVALFVNDDEEVGSLSSQRLIAEIAEGASAALVFEGASLGHEGALKTARRGVSMYEITIAGRAAHAGMNPEDGANALLEAAHVALQIDEIAGDEAGTTVTPTVVQAGTATNVIPDRATLRVDGRVTRADEQVRIDEAIRAIVPRVDGTSLAVDGGPNRPPMEASASAELFDLAVACARDLGHPGLTGLAVGGGSDASFVAPLGVPVIDGLGGVGGGGHQPDEWCDTTRMVERATLVAEMIRRIQGGALAAPGQASR